MIKFPDNSEHIIGVTLGQSGVRAGGVTSTEMEQGAAKGRVRDARPMFLASVEVICTDIGWLQIDEFYMGDPGQTTRFFEWPCLHGFDTDVLMKFTAPPQQSRKPRGGAGLHYVNIGLAVRSLPAVPDAALLAEVAAVAGGVDALYAANGQLAGLTLQPQIDAWASLAG